MKSNGFTLVLLAVIGIAFSTANAQSCSGEGSGGAQDCDESGNKFDYSFDGMPKPHNWRDLPNTGICWKQREILNTAQHLRLHLHQDEAAVKVKRISRV